ncbi:MAG TPA: ABC transporter transmembrane domain-containing protein, partial [bacterium]|nr:ABC transporter transmembrane domain-containing protein [bacterium]
MPYSLREDEKLEEKVNIEIIKRLLKYLKPYKKEVAIVLLLVGIVMAVELANPYFLKITIDRYIKDKDTRGLISIGVLLLILNLVSALCARARIIRMSSVTNRILLDIRQDLYNHIQRLSLSFFDERPVG